MSPQSRSRDAWTGATWLPWVILALGVYVFVPLAPAVGGSFVAGRLGIGGWMVLYAALGYGLTRLRTEPCPVPSRPSHFCVRPDGEGNLA